MGLPRVTAGAGVLWGQRTGQGQGAWGGQGTGPGVAESHGAPPRQRDRAGAGRAGVPALQPSMIPGDLRLRPRQGPRPPLWARPRPRAQLPVQSQAALGSTSSLRASGSSGPIHDPNSALGPAHCPWSSHRPRAHSGPAHHLPRPCSQLRSGRLLSQPLAPQAPPTNLTPPPAPPTAPCALPPLPRPHTQAPPLLPKPLCHWQGLRVGAVPAGWPFWGSEVLGSSPRVSAFAPVPISVPQAWRFLMVP